MTIKFSGYEGLDLSLQELEALVRDARKDWIEALSRVKGVYLVTDTQSGRRYVSSAFAERGVLGRWSKYIASDHGGDFELRSSARGTNLSFARHAIRISLLEHRNIDTADEEIIEREAYWRREIFGSMSQGDPIHL